MSCIYYREFTETLVELLLGFVCGILCIDMYSELCDPHILDSQFWDEGKWNAQRKTTDLQ